MRRAMSSVFGLVLAIVVSTVVWAQQEVPVIENGSRGSLPEAPGLTLRATAGTEGPDEALLYQPTGILFAPDGTLLIPDRGNRTIHVYRRDGGFIRRIGSRGSGPGEFQMPAGPYFSWVGELVVPDPMNQRTSFFTPEGVFLRSEPMSLTGTIVIGGSQIPTVEGEYIRTSGGSGGMLIMVRRDSGGATAASTPGAEDRKLIEIVDGEGDKVRSFGDMLEHENPRVAGVMNQVALDYDPIRRKIAVAFSNLPEIHIYDEQTGTHELIFNRRVPFTPREPSFEERRVTSPDGRSVQATMSVVADQVTADVAYDPQGRLWALTYLVDSDQRTAREEEGEYAGMMRLEVYSQVGELLTAISLDEPADVIAFDAEGDLWLMDSDYELSVRRFEVRWP
jgi:hypothetical protein